MSEGLTDEQMSRLDTLSAKPALDDAEMAEMDALNGTGATSATPPKALPVTSEEQVAKSPTNWKQKALDLALSLTPVGNLASAAEAASEAYYGEPSETAQAYKSAVRQSATFGFEDELMTDEEKKSARVRAHVLSKRNPGVSIAGSLVGGAMVPIPGVGSAKGAAGIVKPVLKQVAASSALGGIGGIGSSDAGDVGGVVDDALTGMKWGGGIGAGMSGIQGVVRSAPALARKASAMAVRAAGSEGGITNALAKMGFKTKEQVEEFGRKLLEYKLIGFGSSKDDVAKRARELQSRAGAGYGSVVDAADAVRPYDTNATEAAVREYLEKKLNPMSRQKAGMANEYLGALGDAAQEAHSPALPPRPGYQKPVTEGFDPLLTDLPPRDDLSSLAELLDELPPASAAVDAAPTSFQRARQIKTSAQSSVDQQASTEAKQLQKGAVAAGTRDFKRQISETLGSDELDMLNIYGDRYGVGKTAEKLANNAATREASRQAPGGWMVPIAAGAAGQVFGGATHGAESAAGAFAIQQVARLMKERGPAGVAVGTDTAAKILAGPFGETLRRAAAAGPKSLATTHYLLSGKSAEYRAEMNGGSEKRP